MLPVSAKSNNLTAFIPQKFLPSRESNRSPSHPLFFAAVHVDHALFHVDLHGVVDGPRVHVLVTDGVARVAPATPLPREHDVRCQQGQQCHRARHTSARSAVREHNVQCQRIRATSAISNVREHVRCQQSVIMTWQAGMLLNPDLRSLMPWRVERYGSCFMFGEKKNHRCDKARFARSNFNIVILKQKNVQL